MQIIKTYSEEDTKKFAFNLAKILKNVPENYRRFYLELSI